MARRRVGILIAVTTLLGHIPSVAAFSASLSPPWGSPGLSLRSSAKCRRWEESFTVMFASAHDETTDNEHSTRKTQDNASLEHANGGSSPEITIAHSVSSKSPNEKATNRSTWMQLFAMTRPSNFPGVVLLHVLGTYLALKSPYVPNTSLLSILLRPGMMVVLACLILTSASSMMVNDYFDNQIGVDKDTDKPLVGGTVSMADAKKCLYYMYQSIAIALAFVPGALTRLMVVVGNINTYWYTKHLKPITWVKNAVCASVMAMSPATSAAAAFHLLSTRNSFLVFGVSDLTRLVATLFLGFLGREILMDINDMENDAACNVQTVPVVKGRIFASRAALLSTTAMTTCAMLGPLWRLLESLGGNVSLKTIMSALRSNPGGCTRQLIFASLGCLPMMRRAFDAYKSEGNDRAIVDKAVNEGKITFMFILASFV